MKFIFRRNTKSVQEINSEFVKGTLFVDPNYQRRKVWNIQDKVRLIETILLEFVMPEVFFWVASRDPETGVAITHIVDGQQRINAITEFISGDFYLNEKYLLDEVTKERCGDKYFNELSDDYKKIVWGYSISYVDIDASCRLEDIKQMFNRLNLTNYSLNLQEKRNSMDSEFGDKSLSLSNMDFWNNKKVFSSNDAKRMKDVEYCCSIYILAQEGIVDQTNGKKINDYYDDYKEQFDEDNKLTERILLAMSMIDSLMDKTTLSFISKKTQMYTLFSVCFKMINEDIKISNEIFERFKQFVEAYNSFRNGFIINSVDAQLDYLYDSIKKYKLASSEGINKITNRMIRFEILYKICVEKNDNMLEQLNKISLDFVNQLSAFKTKVDKVDNVDLDNVE